MRFISVLLFLTLCQCGYEHTGLPVATGETSPRTGQDAPPVVVNFELLKSEVFQPYCFACHSNGTRNAAGVNLETYGAVFPNADTIRDAVASGFMPRGSSIPEVQKQLLFTWIDAGAPEFGEVATESPFTNSDSGQPPRPIPQPPRCREDDRFLQVVVAPRGWVPIYGNYYYDQQTQTFVTLRHYRSERKKCDD